VKDENGKDIFIKAGEVRDYITDFFWQCLEFYNITEILGCPPFSGGWTEWPYEPMRALFLIKLEQQLMDQEKTEQT